MNLRAPALTQRAASFEPRREPSLAPARQQSAPQRVLPRSRSRVTHQVSWMAWFVAISVSLALLYGYAQSDSWGLTPGNGLGYWIGIAGGLGILATLAYPVRKYWRPLNSLGTVAGWFRVHMLLGILGPAVIMFHSNFHLGALNSNVALYTMLCVAGSGIVGRYLYGKIHEGLQGRRSELTGMVAEAADMRRILGGDLPENSPMWSELMRLESKARQPTRGLLAAVGRSISLAGRANVARSRVARDARRFIDAECRSRGLTRKQRRAWLNAARTHLDAYFGTLKGAARLIVFERLFALWHVLHVPIFAVMAVSVIIHIVAVHFY